ncbi:LacI family DNA-binding transcriptional regulator [Paenibacillus sediminis]|uniref:LacI family transcriptional regulator n=1 Tax=Paenibacillus sediminis TaxID=664909 RepID=A0ABS4GZ08_9BACL|nr:LacI family DNA-binding transcriptional regulator [Paenibacillus sediminis]MBP1935501.1 LacI family transcriptional regulator [Paenibacillus sediminis]
MVTIRDVANRAGVAISTASYALNNDPRVSEETRRKVLKVVEEMNYRPNAIARSLKRKKSETIGLFLNDFGGPFFSSVIQGVEEVVSSNGYNLVACSTYGGNHNTTTNRFLQEKQLDAAIILGPNIPDELIVQVASKDFPVVVMDRELKAEHVHSVLVDNEQGAYTATRHLINLGHRKIAYLSGPVNSYNNQKRLVGFKRALEEADIAFQSAINVQGHFTEHGGYQVMKSLLMSKNVPDAIFSANDEMAIGAIQALTEAGIRVPQDVAIVGFDDIRLSSYIRPALSTIGHPKQEWGTVATHVVFQTLQDPSEQSRSIMLDTELIIRDSCGAALQST